VAPALGRPAIGEPLVEINIDGARQVARAVLVTTRPSIEIPPTINQNDVVTMFIQPSSVNNGFKAFHPMHATLR
jgi:hypothetical protein